MAELSAQDLCNGLEKGQRRALARAITLVESRRTADMDKVAELFALLPPGHDHTHRIAITGTPGVGKSTLIEGLGLKYLEAGHRVAVLAVDPSSQVNQGSILGDKTRMEHLSRHEHAFVRPSPAADTLGGVTKKTRESIRLCEAAGYDRIIIETVGVGQSEVSVKGMVDSFILMLAGGGGDELQGIKRGVMEMADILVINKADGNMADAARHTANDYRAALHLLSAPKNGWHVDVMLTSAMEGSGLDELLKRMDAHLVHLREGEELSGIRALQSVAWFAEELEQGILDKVRGISRNEQWMAEMKQEVKEGRLDALAAVKKTLEGMNFNSSP